MNKEEEIVKRVLSYFFEVVRQDLEFQTYVVLEFSNNFISFTVHFQFQDSANDDSEGNV